MLPGPDAYVRCPSCAALARHSTLLSGNSFGAKVWSDGFVDAPMYPDPPPYVQCRRCHTCYWLARAEELAEEDAPHWGEDVPFVRGASEESMLWALKSGRIPPGPEERALRTIAWWKANDAMRGRRGKRKAVSDWVQAERLSNLKAFAELPAEDEHDQVRRAEAYRQLGDFEAARKTLSEVTDPDFSGLVARMLEFCDEGDTRVRLLW
jgi:hypothetical protein